MTGGIRPHPATVAREAVAPWQRAADALLRAISYAGDGGRLSRLRTGDAVIRAAAARSNLFLAEIDYCHGDRAAAIARIERARLDLHREAGRLIGPPWEFGSISGTAAADVRRMLHDLAPARRALPPMRETSYGGTRPSRGRRPAGRKTASPKAPSQGGRPQ